MGAIYPVDQQTGGVEDPIFGGGGLSLVKIWENPDPTQNMTPSDITIPSVAKFDKLIMFYRKHKSDTLTMSQMFLKNYTTDIIAVNTSDSGATVRRRDISIADDVTLHIGNCKTATGATAGENNNSYNIPLVLYAIYESP